LTSSRTAGACEEEKGRFIATPNASDDDGQEPVKHEPTGLSSHLRKLTSQSAVYGAADVFTNLVSFLLLPLYTRFLTPRDYAVLAVLLLLTSLGKVLFRLGQDSAFFRVYYDAKSDAERRALAGTVAIFTVSVASLLFGALVYGAPLLVKLLFSHDPPPSSWVVLATLDVYLGVFAFMPLSLLRIQDRPGLFSVFSASRHTVNIVLKVVLVVTGHGVFGVLLSDVIATGLFSLALLPILARNLTLELRWSHLKETLSFGLPKVPHALMIQVQNLADRRLLEFFVSHAQLGLYHVAYNFGMAVKFPLSAFEPAWQPFVYSQIHRPDAPRMLARIATYAAAAFITVGLPVAMFSREIVKLMTGPKFHAAHPVVPVIVLAYLIHGIFLLTSIGIGIAKKAHYYPVVTAAAASTNIGMNLALIPRWGMMGAAWATVAAYGVMAILGFVLSRRVYPIPYEGGRIARLGVVGLSLYFVSLLAPDIVFFNLLFKSGLLALAPMILWTSGFCRDDEKEWLRRRAATLQSRWSATWRA
jgi:O-antigen/teichoic acid export membrane protein